MKRKLIVMSLIMTVLSVSLFFGTKNANAASLNNRTSYSVGTDYKKNFLDLNQINTTEDAEYANNVYSNMKWNSILNVKPTKSNLKGKHSNGYYYLESSILFFSGHGNSDTMGWNYKSKGGNYAVNITTGTGNYNYTDGSLGIGLGQFNSSQNDLVVFAGCKTAEGSSNITKYMVDRGAKTSIGWKVSIGAGSHTNWLKRFNDKLKTNSSTIQEAASYADGYNYVDNGVKNYVIYGNKFQIPAHGFLIAMTNPNLKDDDVENQYVINEKVFIPNNYDSVSYMKQNIDQIITSKISSTFNKNDYKIEINGVDQKIYDYVLYVNGVRTDLGYTVITKNNEILSIYDNTKNKNINILKLEIASQTKNRILNYKETFNSPLKVVENIKKDNLNSTLFVKDEMLFFNTTFNKLYRVILVEVENSKGQFSVVEHYEEI